VLDFLDYYFQLLGYISARKDRRARFDHDTSARALRGQEYVKEFKSYCGRERVVLRKRRTKLKVDQFHIIAQVGQGGYGEVFIARKQESGEVCALKKMRKRTLFKMDEVRARGLIRRPIVHRSFDRSAMFWWRGIFSLLQKHPGLSSFYTLSKIQNMSISPWNMFLEAISGPYSITLVS